MRTRVQNTEDIKILEKVVKRYKFNLIDEDKEDQEQRQQIIQKRKLQISDVYTSGEEEGNEGVDEVDKGVSSACGSSERSKK